MSDLPWSDLVRLVVEWLEEQRDTRTKTAADGRTILPTFAELEAEHSPRAAARELVRVACLADPRITQALGAACANAKGPDHDVLRDLVGALPTDPPGSPT